MSSVLLQVNRRTLRLAAAQSAILAAALVIAAPASARAGARTVTGEHALIVLAGVLVAVGAGASRGVFRWLMQCLGPRERLLVIGMTSASLTLARELLNKRLHLGVDIVGFIDVEPATAGHLLENTRAIGTIDDVPEIVRQRRIDRVVVDLADARARLPMDKLLELRLRGIHVDHLASVYERYTGKIALENLRPSWLIFSSGFRHTRTLALAKRLLDIIAGTSGLLLSAPLMLVIAAAVKLTSPGPIFYSQRRVGKNGKIFSIRKFRSMHVDAEA